MVQENIVELVRLVASNEENRVIFGLNHRQWQDIIMFIHKAETFYDYWKSGKKQRGQDGQMDNIIMESMSWSDLPQIEESIRQICFSFHNSKSLAQSKNKTTDETNGENEKC